MASDDTPESSLLAWAAVLVKDRTLLTPFGATDHVLRASGTAAVCQRLRDMADASPESFMQLCPLLLATAKESPYDDVRKALCDLLTDVLGEPATTTAGAGASSSLGEGAGAAATASGTDAAEGGSGGDAAGGAGSRDGGSTAVTDGATGGDATDATAGCTTAAATAGGDGGDGGDGDATTPSTPPSSSTTPSAPSATTAAGGASAGAPVAGAGATSDTPTSLSSPRPHTSVRAALAAAVEPTSPSCFVPLQRFYHLIPASVAPAVADAPPGTEPPGLRDPEHRRAVDAAVLEQCFGKTARVSNLHRVLTWHPSFLTAFIETQTTVMEEDGPLQLAWRHYVAIMAAAQHNCTYLVRRKMVDFLLSGGDPEWLASGITGAAVPRKLANLATLNKLMAHMPWTVNKSHIAELVVGDFSWSVNELVHALVILSTYHSLSVLVLGMGVVEEADIGTSRFVASSSLAARLAALDAAASVSSPPPPAASAAAPAGSTATPTPTKGGPAESDPVFVKRLLDGLDAIIPGDDASSVGGAAEEVAADSFTAAGTGAELPAPAVPSESVDPYSRFVGSRATYVDFKTSEGVFRTQDFSWEDHGYSLLQTYFPKAADLLEAEFSLVYNLTYNNFGKEGMSVNTEPFREATWYYVHRLFGICNDDYEYSMVNHFILLDVKCFVKRVVCFPDTVSAEDFTGFSDALRPDEKCHVILLAMEARKQAELLHCLYALMSHLTGS